MAFLISTLSLVLFFADAHQSATDNPEVVTLEAASKQIWAHPPLDWKAEEQQQRDIRQLIAEGRVQTGADYLRAEAIVERRFTPDDQLLAHVLALDSLASGDLKARWLAAESLDHYLSSVGARQVFGTQYAFRDPSQPRLRVETEPDLVSDSLRKVLCVAPMSGPGAAPLMLETGIFIDSLALKNCPATSDAADSLTMTKLYSEDQADRRDPSSDWRKMQVRDYERREQVKHLLSSGELHTGNDFYHAALIYQHSSLSSDYLLAHTLAMVGIALGSKEARWLAAATLDRYLRSGWRPQVFGTQTVQLPWDNELKLAPMDQDLVSDPARARLCVLPMAERTSKNAQGTGLPASRCQ